MPKKIRYVFDGVRVHRREDEADRSDYVRAWSEGKGRNKETAVQVWKGKIKPEGDPDGDWAMPGVLSVDTAIAQAVVQTR